MELKKFNWTSDGLPVENFVDDCVDTFWSNFALHNDPEIKEIGISEMKKRMQKYIPQYKGRNFITFAEFHFNGSCFCRNINLYNTLIAPETVDSRKSTFRVFKNLAEENNHFIQSKSLTEMDE